MKKRFTESQIVSAIKRQEGGGIAVVSKTEFIFENAN
jgi:hypothetical protein